MPAPFTPPTPVFLAGELALVRWGQEPPRALGFSWYLQPGRAAPGFAMCLFSKDIELISRGA